MFHTTGSAFEEKKISKKVQDLDALPEVICFQDKATADSNTVTLILRNM